MGPQADPLRARADVDTYVSLITPHLLARVSEQDAPALAEELCTALAAEVDEHAETRLQGLTQVFNTLSQPEPQLKAFTATCAYAQRAGLTALLSPVIKVMLGHCCLSARAWQRRLTQTTAAAGEHGRLAQRADSGPRQ